MSHSQITGTFTYDVSTKEFRLDCNDKRVWCVRDTLSFPVLVAQNKAGCGLASGDKGFVALTLVFDNKHNGLLVLACENKGLTEYHRYLKSVRQQADQGS